MFKINKHLGKFIIRMCHVNHASIPEDPKLKHNISTGISLQPSNCETGVKMTRTKRNAEMNDIHQAVAVIEIL